MMQKDSLILAFQYILCCGSTHARRWSLCEALNFNTSYVVVQRLLAGKTIGLTIFQYILCCGSTGAIRSLEVTYKGFQYILCCGSTCKFGIIMI